MTTTTVPTTVPVGALWTPMLTVQNGREVVMFRWNGTDWEPPDPYVMRIVTTIKP